MTTENRRESDKNSDEFEKLNKKLDNYVSLEVRIKDFVQILFFLNNQNTMINNIETKAHKSNVSSIRKVLLS